MLLSWVSCVRFFPWNVPKKSRVQIHALEQIYTLGHKIQSTL